MKIVLLYIILLSPIIYAIGICIRKAHKEPQLDNIIEKLKKFSTKELKDEVQRRTKISVQLRAEKFNTDKRCRNCKHLIIVEPNSYSTKLKCGARTYKRRNKYTKELHDVNYITTLSRKCDKFELELNSYENKRTKKAD